MPSNIEANPLAYQQHILYQANAIFPIIRIYIYFQ